MEVSMRLLLCTGICLVAQLLLPTAAQQPVARPKNVCINGGFEEVKLWRGQEHPAAWPVFAVEGLYTPLTTDARTGKRAARLHATGNTMVGMNQHCPKIVAGTVRFWYKAVRSAVQGKNLIVYVIPMRDAAGKAPEREIDPLGQGSARLGYGIPAEHVGDGKWHPAEFDFDFRDTPTQHTVIAPRINEFARATGPGELLLDDVELTPLGF
jgi:hypothetical protein